MTRNKFRLFVKLRVGADDVERVLEALGIDTK